MQLRHLAQSIGELVDQHKRASSLSTISTSEITLAASAYVIAFQLPLPSEKVDNTAQYYIASVVPQVEAIVSQLIEYLPINFKRLCDLIRDIWCTRYNMVYDPISENTLTAVSMALHCSSKTSSNINNSLFELLSGNLKHIVTQLDGSLKEAMKSE